MSSLEAIVLGIVQGLTEFLPISSTGHLRIVPAILGWEDPGAAFTAVCQLGTMAAVLVYFRADLWRIAVAFLRSLRGERWNTPDVDGRMGWYIALGTIPISILGLALHNVIDDQFRSLYVIGTALIVFSFVMLRAEAAATQERELEDLTPRDGLMIGLAQAIALIPGVSRSGATISAGLMRDLDRVTATRFAFFLSIPALTAAGLLELKDSLHGGVGLGPTLIGTVVAFVVAYASIAWLLRFVAHHSIAKFVPYRVALGVVVLGVLAITGSS
jgi:undecaprenyl-diphosphatase